MLKTRAFGDPIAAFTGRFLDSTFAGDWQATFRTARAYGARYVPQRGRILVQMGSAVASYNVNTFFTRLAAREALESANSFPILTQSNNLGVRNVQGIWAFEHMLTWDKFFYPEYTNSGWTLNLGDGQQKLNEWDFDDRGYVYIAGRDYHWGIAFDDKGTGGGLMDPIFQEPNFAPDSIWVARGASGKYFLTVGRMDDGNMQIWDVTNPAAPVRQPINLRIHVLKAAHNADHFFAVGDDQALYIWSGDALGAGQTFEKKITTAKYNGVTTDGTNFYAAGPASDFTSSYISIFRPNGNGGYTQTDTLIPNVQMYSISYGSGDYLGVTGPLDYAHLFKLVGGIPQEVPFTNDFMREYYQGARLPSGALDSSYAHPPGVQAYGALPLSIGGKQYFIVSMLGLGDVYEIKNDDSVAPTSQGHKGSNNNNAPGRLNTTDVFYGDVVGFIATTPATAAKSITWNFGNAEATGDANSLSGTTGVAVTHQYSGLTTAQVPATRSVTATDNATNSSGSVQVQLKLPVARFGITGFTQLVTAPATGVNLVAGDKFYDGSDGDVEGHVAEFKIDTATTLTKPYAADNSNFVPVGACGAHTLTFAAHYGPYNSSLTTIGPDFKVGLLPAGDFSYTVQPFAATLAAPQRDVANNAVIFAATARASSDTNILSSAQVAALTYQWDLVNAGETVVLAGPSGTGVSTIPSWTVPLASFSTANLRARLTIASPTAPGGTCANATSVKSFTTPLNVPDPQITGSCPNGGPLCNYTVSSISGANIVADGWSMSWSVSPATASPTTSTTATFSPSFTSNGSYTVSVSVTNSLGSKSTSTTASVTNAFKCPTMTADNWAIAYNGPSGCRQVNSNNCATNESIAFSVQPISYPITCNAHTFSWNWGDNSPFSTTQDANHTFTSAGQKSVVVTVNNGQTAIPISVTIGVAGAVVQPPVNPPPVNPTPGGCAVMTQDNWAITFSGSTSGCSFRDDRACSSGEPIAFSIQPVGYGIGCATHTYSWNFNDGTPVQSGVNVNHTFATGGDYNVTVSVSNPGQTLPVSSTVHVGGTSNSCATMNSTSAFVQYSGPSGCSHGNSIPCAQSETVQMSVGYFGYNDSCATHTYTWNFGDGTPTQTGRSVTHQYGAGSYTLKCTIANGKQNFDATIPMVVSAPVVPTFAADFAVALDTLEPNVVHLTPSIDPTSTKITKVAWDFGDGDQSSTSDAVKLLLPTPHRYSKTGTFTVTMTVTGPSNSQVIKTHQVTITLPSRSRGSRH